MTNNKAFYAFLIIMLLLALPFIATSILLGEIGLTEGLKENSRLNPSGDFWNNANMSYHMIFGAFLTLIAPLQIILGWQGTRLVWHKWIGYIFVALAFLTGTGGLFYIVFEGTTGGTVMDIGFSIYGVLVILSAYNTAQTARLKRMKRHKEWALRLFVLAMGSWFYRMWYATSVELANAQQDVGLASDFKAPYDYFMDFAFYVVPLAILEWYFRKEEYKMPLWVSRIFTVLLCFVIVFGTYEFTKYLIAVFSGK